LWMRLGFVDEILLLWMRLGFVDEI
jgi:hypothetical protein